MRAALSIVCAAISCATADPRTSEGFALRIQARVGQKIDAVLRDRGAPTSRFELSNGNTIFEWRQRGVPSSEEEARIRSAVALGAYASALGAGPNTAAEIAARNEWICTTRYEVEPEAATIVDVRFVGTGCNATMPTVPRTVVVAPTPQREAHPSPPPENEELCTEFANGDESLYFGCLRELAKPKR